MIKTARQLKDLIRKFSYASDLSWNIVMESVRNLYQMCQKQ